MHIKYKQFIDSNGTYEHYYYESTFEITYEKDNIICISTSYNWYAGGAPYYGKKNYTYNMKTGKKLTYKDVISGNAKKKIIKKCEEMFKDTWDYEEVMKKVKKKKSYQFYLKDGKVYVCFERGELVYNGAPEIEFETKYK